MLFVERDGGNYNNFLFNLFPVVKHLRCFFLDWKLSKSTVVGFWLQRLFFDLGVGVAFRVADTFFRAIFGKFSLLKDDFLFVRDDLTSWYWIFDV